jgi:hypothetical protein
MLGKSRELVHGASVVLAVAGLAALGVAVPAPAHAYWRGGVWIGVGPAYPYLPPPVYYAPPRYYAPPVYAYTPRVWVPRHWNGWRWVPGHWSYY